MRRRILSIAKWAWLALVFGGGLYYVVRNFDTLGPQLSSISPLRLLAAIGLLVAVKLLLVELSRRSVTTVDGAIGWQRMFTINSVSQLAKYLPGGIWHFVGRAGYYRTDHLDLRRITHAMFIENVWLVVSAMAVGAIAFVLHHVTAPQAALQVGLVAAAWLALVFVMFRVFQRPVNWLHFLEVMAVQVAVWALSGLSFWVLIGDNELPALLAISSFSVAWALGYLAVFAPGGIGVREAALVMLLTGTISAEAAVVYASVHRLLWAGLELALGAIANVAMTRPERKPRDYDAAPANPLPRP